MNAGQATQARFDARGDVDLESTSARPGLASRPTLDGDVRFSIHEDMVGVERDWRAFEQEADCTVFQTFEWLAAWQRHIGARRGALPAIVVGRDASGQVLFLFPFAIETRGWLRRLTWLGSDLCDYNAPLLRADFARQVDAARFVRMWCDIAGALRGHPRLHHDLISFEKIPATVGGQDNPFVQLGVITHPSGAYQTRLAADWEKFYAEKRSSATRRRDRTKRKKLAEFGEVRFVHADGAHVGAALNTLFVQKTQQFAAMGVGNLFARPGTTDFFLGIASDPAMGQLVHVSRLEVGPAVAAVNLGLIFRGTYYHVLASYDGAGEVSRFGPGAAHLHDLMRYAIERGCTMFDFTIGDERYKRDWSDTELKLFDYVSAATPVAWPAVGLSLGFRGLKRWIKQTPAVWNAFSKAREWMGSLRNKPEA